MTPAALAVLRAALHGIDHPLAHPNHAAALIARALEADGWTITPDPTRNAPGNPRRAARITTP